MDETYIKVRGRRNHLYGAVDKRGLTVDFLLSEHRDIAAAKRFFTGAVEQHGTPETITLGGYPATHAAVAGPKGSAARRPRGGVVDAYLCHSHQNPQF